MDFYLKLALLGGGVVEHVPYKLDGLGPDDAFVRDLRMDELDSMSTVELVLDLEKRFGIEIPDEDAQKILTFRELVDYLEPRVPGAVVLVRNERAGEQADAADEVRDGNGRRGPRS